MQEMNTEYGYEMCVVTARAYTRKPPLSPCLGDTDDDWWSTGSQDERPGINCAPDGWVPPGPGPIKAVGRCAKLNGEGAPPTWPATTPR